MLGLHLLAYIRPMPVSRPRDSLGGLSTQFTRLRWLYLRVAVIYDQDRRSREPPVGRSAVGHRNVVQHPQPKQHVSNGLKSASNNYEHRQWMLT